MSRQTREPIISVLGHVDHGKTTVLDWIRKSVIAKGEAGGITQHIGATDVPFEVVTGVCQGLLDEAKLKLPIRGLLFIDTPGHESFTTLRKRGGSVADIAILVVDIREGIMPQTRESIEILRQFKTPFIIAANKLDTINGWVEGVPPEKQSELPKTEFYKNFYGLVGQLGELGMNSNLYTQINDFTQEIAVVPVSGVTGEGIPSLLMVLIGLIQQYLAGKLDVGLDSPARGTILEVKESRGLGTTIDAIIYEGTIKVNDPLVIGGKPPFTSKVKALLRPQALDEMRDPRKKFESVDEVYAASGVKIVAPGIDDAMAGAPVYVGGEDLIREIEEEMSEVEFERDTVGVVVKADTLGSLEAMVNILQDMEIPIKRGSIGKISKTDILEAQAVSEKDKYLGVILAFNTAILDDAGTLAEDKDAKIFSSNIIYRIIEDYEDWAKSERAADKETASMNVTFPAKMRFLPGCTFRTSKPAVFGVEIIAGSLRKGAPVMREDAKQIGYVKEMQDEGESLDEAGQGMKVAVAIDKITVGRQVSEGDVLYTAITSQDVESLKKLGLGEKDERVLKEIIEVRRKK